MVSIATYHVCILTFTRLKILLPFHISIKHIWFAKCFVHITSKSSFEHESVYFLYEIRHSCNVIVVPHLWTIPGSCYKMWPENIKCPFTSVNIFPGIVGIIQIKEYGYPSTLIHYNTSYFKNYLYLESVTFNVMSIQLTHISQNYF